MPQVQHSALTGAELHEPKAASGASANTIYSSDGAGSGGWKKVVAASIDTSSIKNSNKIVLNVTLNNLETAGSNFIVMPIAGSIASINSVIDQAIDADTSLVFKIASVVVTGGGITIASAGSAGGDVDTSTPTAANVLTAYQALEIVKDGVPTTAGARATLSIVLDVS